MQHKATINIGVTVKYSDPAKVKARFCSKSQYRALLPVFGSLEEMSRYLMFKAMYYNVSRPAIINIAGIGDFQRFDDIVTVSIYKSIDEPSIEFALTYTSIHGELETYSNSVNLIRQHNGKTYEQIDTGDINISCDDCVAKCRDELC